MICAHDWQIKVTKASVGYHEVRKCLECKLVWRMHRIEDEQRSHIGDRAPEAQGAG